MESQYYLVSDCVQSLSAILSIEVNMSLSRAHKIYHYFIFETKHIPQLLYYDNIHCFRNLITVNIPRLYTSTNLLLLTTLKNIKFNNLDIISIITKLSLLETLKQHNTYYYLPELINLRYLNCKFNNQNIPEKFTLCTNIRSISISSMVKFTNINQLSYLTGLKTLIKLKTLIFHNFHTVNIDLFYCLETISLNHCDNIHLNYTKLRNISFYHCKNIKIESSSSIVLFSAIHCDNFTLLDCINMKTFIVCMCENMHFDIDTMLSINQLKFVQSPDMCKLPSLCLSDKFTGLNNLFIHAKILISKSLYSNVTQLDIFHNNDFSDMNNFPNLKVLVENYCNVHNISKLFHLEKLKTSSNERINFQFHAKLTKLKIIFNHYLNLTSLIHLKSLNIIYDDNFIFDHEEYESLIHLEKISWMRKNNTSDFINQIDMLKLSRLTTLRSIRSQICLKNINLCTGIHNLRIDWYKCDDYYKLSMLTRLTRLEINNFDPIYMDMRNLTRLEKINIGYTSKIISPDVGLPQFA